jgi:hypothetical protein
MFDFLEGKKTKLVSAMAMAAGAYAVFNGGDPEVASKMVNDGAGMFGQYAEGIKMMWAGAVAYFLRLGVGK